MTTYEERIERARKVVQGEVLLADEIEAIVAAFIGDDEAYVVEKRSARDAFVSAGLMATNARNGAHAGVLAPLNREGPDGC